MLMLPVRAELVRVIGGPTGAARGVRGPTGPIGPAITGPDGPLGPLGRHGATGPQGIAGLFSALAGMTGKPGPFGADGYPGPTGPVGRATFITDENYVRYFENIEGYTGFSPAGWSVGCKFRYTLKSRGFLFVFFTALFSTTSGKIFDVSIISGTGGAPDGGIWAGYPDGQNRFVVPVTDPLKKIPFFLMAILNVSETSLEPPIDFWFDLAARSGTSGFDPPSGKIEHISAVVFEVST
jgi:hypothetical protein